MGSRTAFAMLVLSLFIIAPLVSAEDQAGSADRIHQILLNTKRMESQAVTQSTQVKSAQTSSGQNKVDTNSVEYKIGYKDGYEKALKDLRHSANSSVSTAPASSRLIANMQSQQDSSQANALVQQSFVELVSKHDWDAAIKTTTNAIHYNPENSIAYVNRSWALAEKGKLDDAIRDASHAIELSPRNAMAFNNRAYAYELGGTPTRARQDYLIACELKYKPACGAITKLDFPVARNEKSKVNEMLDRSYVKFQQKDWQAVEDITTRTLKLDPANAIAYVNRTGARTELGLYSTALQDCRRAIELNPQFGIAHNNCAYAYERMGRAEQAIQSYKHACDLGVQQSCQDYNRMSSSDH